MTERAGPKARRRKGGGAVKQKGVQYAVELRVDGRKLELKEFLHDVLGGALDGMVRALRDVGVPRKIRVDVTRL